MAKRTRTLDQEQVEDLREALREKLEPEAELFRSTAEDVLGPKWKTRLLATGYHYATIMRWIAADLPVPKVIWLLLRILKHVPESQWGALFVRPPDQPAEQEEPQ